ncbi:TIGR01212 family radical SAM protein [Desulforhopalus vacuolatus]|uniref:TIGR01212 family radical SAM protein n=1 Tax=Desulforhopalus vacuolatus TaxID=40414 RepID=UPI00196626C3|nr:TIGR01212 family radical SAM protein [Desulforhopalus vacuolatus]MBM9519157.1 TIGR01212 family radical SAM protein [Desulforhopalus vacuolatus]
MTRLVNTFSHHCRDRYGEAVGKLPLDLGIPCPNRLRGGCTFCRPEGFTAGFLTAEDSLSVQIEKGKRILLKGRFHRYFAYFQQESCTALDPSLLLEHCGRLLDDDACVGLILSTRPDLVPDSLLEPLAELVRCRGKSGLLELGLQSTLQRSLDALNRNHTVEDFFSALTRIHRHPPLECGAHLIFGIPGESEAEMIAGVEMVCAAGVDALKLHHLQVVKGTPLARQYARQPFPLFSHEDCVNFLLRLLPRIPQRVVLHRLFSTTHPQLLIAPRWNIPAAELSREVTEGLHLAGLAQGALAVGEE